MLINGHPMALREAHVVPFTHQERAVFNSFSLTIGGSV